MPLLKTLKQKMTPLLVLYRYHPCAQLVRARFGLFSKKVHRVPGKGSGRALVTFVVPHKDCSQFIKRCVESIHKHASGLDYAIRIADDCSIAAELAEVLKLVDDRTDVTQIMKSKGHSFVLEWLYSRADSRFVVILDQDALLLSARWRSLMDEFERHPQLLAAGLRDKMINRDSPQMLHPAFMLIDKDRSSRHVRQPCFFGSKPSYQRYRISQDEPYHAFSCKALTFHADALLYLDNYQTRYGFGSVGYHRDQRSPIVYHQWYSGRIRTLADTDTIDTVPVSNLKKYADDFLRDHEHNTLDLRPVVYDSWQEAVGVAR